MKSNLNIDEKAPEDLRCCCGKLLAVRTPAGYEIRCVRCKTVQLLPLPESGRAEAEDTRG